jgi:hypothetical protein
LNDDVVLKTADDDIEQLMFAAVTADVGHKMLHSDKRCGWSICGLMPWVEKLIVDARNNFNRPVYLKAHDVVTCTLPHRPFIWIAEDMACTYEDRDIEQFWFIQTKR